jgi:ATP-dependent DNA helicase RecG
VTVEEYEGDDGSDSLARGAWSRYPLTEQLNQRQLRVMVKTALEGLNKTGACILPAEIKKKFNCRGWKKPVTEPFSRSERKGECEKKVIFEELFLFQLVMAARKRDISGARKPTVYHRGDMLNLYSEKPALSADREPAQVWEEYRGS